MPLALQAPPPPTVLPSPPAQLQAAPRHAQRDFESLMPKEPMRAPELGAPAKGKPAQAVASEAAKLGGTIFLNAQRDWRVFMPKEPMRAPEIGAPARTDTVPVAKAGKGPASPTITQPQLVGAHSLVDLREPDRRLGRDVVIPVEVPKSTGLDKITATVRNADRGIQSGNLGDAPRLDIRAYKGGAPLASVRVTPQANTAAGAVHVGDGRTDLVVGGGVNTADSSKNTVSVAAFSGNLGARAVITNPGGADAPAGKPGARGSRMELIGTPGGKVVASGSEQRKPVEFYLFKASSGTPGTKAGTEQTGAGVRVNAFEAKVGHIPVSGSASVEGYSQKATTAKGKTTEAPGATAAVDITVGKGDTEAVVQGDYAQAATPGSRGVWEFFVGIVHRFGGR